MNKLRLVVNNQKKGKKEIFFIKQEFQTILNLYAKMVSNGAWKDYGLSLGKKQVSFDVYQRASDKPVFRIFKNLRPKSFKEKYILKDKNGSIIKKSENLSYLIDKTSWSSLKVIK